MRYWLAVLIAAVACGQTATVHGRVLIQVLQEPVVATISIEGREAQTGSDGLYRMEGVRVGRHVMDVRSPGFKLLHMEVALKAGDDVELPVAELRIAGLCGFPDEPLFQSRWMRDKAQVGVLRGTIAGLRRRALSGVGVTFTDARGETVRKVTDGSGRFELELKPGSYGVRFDRTGYWPVTFRTSSAAGVGMDFGEQSLSACDDGVCREPRKIAPGHCE